MLVVSEHRGRLTPADSVRFLVLLRDLPEEEEAVLENPTDLVSLTREEGLSAYDAAYLYSAMRRGLPLTTCDRGLRRAATNVG